MAIIADQHLHSSFSGDSDCPMEKMVQAAIAKGLKYITFTEHMDYDFPVTPDTPAGYFEVNTDSYLYELLSLRARYENDIHILFGIELGLMPSVVRKNIMLTKAHEFDFIIGSSHLCNGRDPYDPAFFACRSEREALEEYFRSELENIRCYSYYDVYGHLDYAVRYCPSKGANYSYADYTDLIDEILSGLIEQEKGIEVNTGSLANGMSRPNPCEDIIRRYRELGGEIITIGSDSHDDRTIAFGFDRVTEMLKQNGYKYYSLFEGRIAEYKLL